MNIEALVCGIVIVVCVCVFGVVGKKRFLSVKVHFRIRVNAPAAEIIVVLQSHVLIFPLRQYAKSIGGAIPVERMYDYKWLTECVCCVCVWCTLYTLTLSVAHTFSCTEHSQIKHSLNVCVVRFYCFTSTTMSCFISFMSQITINRHSIRPRE